MEDDQYCFTLNGSAPVSTKLTDNNLTSTQATLAAIAVALVTQLLANAFGFVRKYVYHDSGNLDTAFDAGGKVSMGLLVANIVATWTWAATLLQSSAVGAKYGLSGPFWYASGASVQILLFAIVAVQIKIRAPGAKTFLQVIQIRFGKATHIVFIVFALTTNFIVTSMLMLGGAEALITVADGYSVEFALCIIIAITASLCLIGGLGATFYASYVQSSCILLIILLFSAKVYFLSSTTSLGSPNEVYRALNCIEMLKFNNMQNALGMNSVPGFMFGIINLVGNFGAVFVDQSYWQHAIAAKPRQTVLGYLGGGLVWFTVPFSFATTMGLAYLALSVKNGSPLLTGDQVSAGLVAVSVAGVTWGTTGKFMIFIIVLLAVTSTAAAEIIAVSAILIYDIYMIYVRPFAPNIAANVCVLCGKPRAKKNANTADFCVCESSTTCKICEADDEIRQKSTSGVKPPYKCQTHNRFKEYMEIISRMKTWAILWVSIVILPSSLLLFELHISLGWLYLFMGVMIGSAVLPVVLSLWWVRLNSFGMISGAIGGLTCGLTAWLVTASRYDGGLANFMENTGQDWSMFMGNIVSVIAGGIFTVLLTLITTRNYVFDNSKDIWEQTRDIDNPLYPWTELYKKELDLANTSRINLRPPPEHIENAFYKEKRMAVWGSVGFTVLLIIVWPTISAILGRFSAVMFTIWVGVVLFIAFAGFLYLIIVPVFVEVVSTIREYQSQKLKSGSSTGAFEKISEKSETKN